MGIQYMDVAAMISPCAISAPSMVIAYASAMAAVALVAMLIGSVLFARGRVDAANFVGRVVIGLAVGIGATLLGYQIAAFWC